MPQLPPPWVVIRAVSRGLLVWRHEWTAKPSDMRAIAKDAILIISGVKLGSKILHIER